MVSCGGPAVVDIASSEGIDTSGCSKPLDSIAFAIGPILSYIGYLAILDQMGAPTDVALQAITVAIMHEAVAHDAALRIAKFNNALRAVVCFYPVNCDTSDRINSYPDRLPRPDHSVNDWLSSLAVRADVHVIVRNVQSFTPTAASL